MPPQLNNWSLTFIGDDRSCQLQFSPFITSRKTTQICRRLCGFNFFISMDFFIKSLGFSLALNAIIIMECYGLCLSLFLYFFYENISFIYEDWTKKSVHVTGLFILMIFYIYLGFQQNFRSFNFMKLFVTEVLRSFMKAFRTFIFFTRKLTECVWRWNFVIHLTFKALILEGFSDECDNKSQYSFFSFMYLLTKGVDFASRSVCFRCSMKESDERKNYEAFLRKCFAIKLPPVNMLSACAEIWETTRSHHPAQLYCT